MLAQNNNYLFILDNYNWGKNLKKTYFKDFGTFWPKNNEKTVIK